MKTVMDTWILCFGIPTVGFFADNGGEFVNIKMDELIARIGVTIRDGLLIVHGPMAFMSGIMQVVI